MKKKTKSKNVNDYIFIDEDIEVIQIVNDLVEGYFELEYIVKATKASGRIQYYNLPKNINGDRLLTMIKADISNQGKGAIRIC
jgi:hypothetical protein